LTSLAIEMCHSAEIQVLYSDAALLVINKPAGLSTLPDGYNLTLPHVKSLLEPQAGHLWIVHRLDKETSGVLILARSALAHRSLNIQFEHHLVRKVYHALVDGTPAWTEHTIDLPLRPNGDRSHRTVVDQQTGKPAVTHLEILERFGCYCLLEAVPETGRTHQIRAHLSSLGLYIVGDKLYRRKKSQVQQDRAAAINLTNGMGLHAKSLEITHPLSNERLKFEAPYPLAWDTILHELRQGSSIKE
jgi:tRNA pseudouridine32 synthase/23S rRNA pseudouridine746 synthase